MATKAQIQRLYSKTRTMLYKAQDLTREAEQMFGQDDEVFMRLADTWGMLSAAMEHMDQKIQDPSARCTCAPRRRR